MPKKSSLLKELGWNDELIRHFMIDDVHKDEALEELSDAKVYDSHSITLTFNAEKTGSSFFIKG